jgi:ketosteroid isomerase-like protein
MRNFFWFTVALAAACSPAEQQQTAAPAAPDTAATRAALQTMLDGYEAKALAGDVAGLVDLYTDNAVLYEPGVPTVNGRAGVEAAYTAIFSTTKLQSQTITVGTANSARPGLATALGTYEETLDSAGSIQNLWGRWAASFAQGPDGNWRIAFLMAFPDSVKAAQ